MFGLQQSDNVLLPATEVKPAAHAVQVEAPLSVYVFVGHTLHAAEPETLLAVPAAHVTHGPPFGPVYPALHEQSLTFVLPNREFAFVVQLVHVALPFAGL